MNETALTRFLSEQTVARLREMRSELRREIEQTHGRLEELEADLRRVETAISERPRGRGVGTPRPPSRDQTRPQSALSMKDAIVAILATRPTESWSTQDVLDELERQGNAPGGSKPLNTVGNRLLDLVKAGRINRVARGTYSVGSSLSLIPKAEEVESS